MHQKLVSVAILHTVSQNNAGSIYRLSIQTVSISKTIQIESEKHLDI